MEEEFNTSSPINETVPVVTQNQRIIVGVVLLCVSLTGILGNTLVILAVFASKKLQTFNNIFVVNLSVADFLTCVTLPLQCVVMFSPDDVLPIPNWACGVVGASSFIFVGCSVYTLASIGTYRFILLKDVSGRVAPKLQKPCIAVLWVATIWVIPVLVNVIPHAIGAGHFGINEKYHACGAQTSHPRHRELEVAQIFGMYTIPFIVIIVTYILIFVIIRQHTRQMVRRLSRSSIHLSSSSVTRQSISQDSQRTKQIRQRQISITKNMFYVVLAFIICLTPYAICLLYPDLNGQLYAAAFVSANSCVNPFLYAFKHPQFGEVFKALLKCRCGNVPEQSHAFKRLLRITSSTSDIYL